MNLSIMESIKDSLQSAKQRAKDNPHNAQALFQNTREDVLAARKCENINDPVDTYVIDYLAMVFSRIFIALHIIPNVVTMLSMASGVAGGVLLAMNRSLRLDILGAVLVLFSAIFDASDGQVARLTKHYSRLGRMLDGLSDASVYFTLYLACVLRLWNVKPFADNPTAHVILICLGIVTFVAYVAQCQLPDYFKNLHMFMIDNSSGNELSRAKHIKEEMTRTPKGTFAYFTQVIYWNYTHTQERRAPRTQELLDAIEVYGKNKSLCDGFYAESRRLVKLTNLLTFNLRTFVLMLCMFLHLELAGLLFVLLVLEPVRWILLQRYERLSKDLLPLVV